MIHTGKQDWSHFTVNEKVTPPDILMADNVFYAIYMALNKFLCTKENQSSV